jgi:hypothetical protein
VSLVLCAYSPQFDSLPWALAYRLQAMVVVDGAYV